jgi:hypothetical protein
MNWQISLGKVRFILMSVVGTNSDRGKKKKKKKNFGCPLTKQTNKQTKPL